MGKDSKRKFEVNRDVRARGAFFRWVQFCFGVAIVLKAAAPIVYILVQS